MTTEESNIIGLLRPWIAEVENSVAKERREVPYRHTLHSFHGLSVFQFMASENSENPDLFVLLRSVPDFVETIANQQTKAVLERLRMDMSRANKDKIAVFPYSMGYQDAVDDFNACIDAEIKRLEGNV